MKFGPRKPNIKKRIKARTTGKVKRKIKSSVNPLYGKKGMSWVNNPKKSAYNIVYKKTTFDAIPFILPNGKEDRSKSKFNSDEENQRGIKSPKAFSYMGCFGILLLIASFFYPLLFFVSIPLYIYILIKSLKEKKERENKHKEERERNEHQLQISDKLIPLYDYINKTKEIKKIDSFFENISKIFTLKKESFELLDRALDKGYMSKAEVIEVKVEIDLSINDLIKDYIKEYEKKSFEVATRLKTEKGQRNNYKRSYDDLHKYNHLFDPEVQNYINERWQII